MRLASHREVGGESNTGGLFTSPKRKEKYPNPPPSRTENVTRKHLYLRHAGALRRESLRRRCCSVCERDDVRRGATLPQNASRTGSCNVLSFMLFFSFLVVSFLKRLRLPFCSCDNAEVNTYYAIRPFLVVAVQLLPRGQPSATH